MVSLMILTCFSIFLNITYFQN